jgi:hypothetical protein
MPATANVLAPSTSSTDTSRTNLDGSLRGTFTNRRQADASVRALRNKAPNRRFCCLIQWRCIVRGG